MRQYSNGWATQHDTFHWHVGTIGAVILASIYRCSIKYTRNSIKSGITLILYICEVTLNNTFVVVEDQSWIFFLQQSEKRIKYIFTMYYSINFCVTIKRPLIFLWLKKHSWVHNSVSVIFCYIIYMYFI